MNNTIRFEHAGRQIEIKAISGMYASIFPGGGLVNITVDGKSVANLPAATNSEEILRIAKEKADAI